jgi:asparagine N-glycosylation enzyme membrane subunit Stt3
MSLVAVPVFLIARRVLTNWLSLLAAALTLLIPSFAYTGVLMSENAFFPLFMVAILAIVRALECPTGSRQFVALASFLPVVAVRTEGLILFPTFLSAIAIVCLASATRGGGL